MAAEIARSPAAWERLAKSWLLEVIERSPLDEIDDLPVGWISHEAAPLIAEVLGQLSDPGAIHNNELSPASRERIQGIVAGRDPQTVLRRLPGQFAALQTLLIEALDREFPDRDRREFTRAVARLAEVFAAIQAIALDAIEDAPGAATEAGLEEAGDFDSALRRLIADAGARGAPLALAHFEVEGVERISKGYGSDAAERMIEAVARVLEGKLTPQMQLFRLGQGQFAALVPGADVEEATTLAASVAELVERSQAGGGPRVTVAAGIASYPRHGGSPDALREAAETAAWGARADGRDVAVARSGMGEPH
jgi:GGDEF domain-containing protein